MVMGEIVLPSVTPLKELPVVVTADCVFTALIVDDVIIDPLSVVVSKEPTVGVVIDIIDSV